MPGSFGKKIGNTGKSVVPSVGIGYNENIKDRQSRVSEKIRWPREKEDFISGRL